MSQHIKTHEGYDVKVPTQDQTNLNTVLGALGTAGFAGLNLQNLLGGLLGGGSGNNAQMVMALASIMQPRCSDDHCVTRYDLQQEKEIASKDSKIALLEANIYNDQKSLELYRYIDGKLSEINSRLAGQDVRNQGFVDAFRELQKDIDCKVALEAERRECADGNIVCYANSVFAPKSVVNYTAGTESTVMETFNPLCKCK